MPDSNKIVMNAALPDDRPQEKREKDYRSVEIAAASIATFMNVKPAALFATVFDQWYVGSCVPHGFYTMLEYEGILPPTFNQSQLRAYRKRSNYPVPGSIGVDMLDKIRAGQSGDFPTPPGFTEAKATTMDLILGDKVIKDFKYFQHLDAKGVQDFTLVPPDVAQGKAVAIFIFATEEEWSEESVEIKSPDLARANAAVTHCVCLVPNGDFTENGKQWLTVHDSAKFGGRHLRYITYDFLLKRAYFSAKVYAAGSLPTVPNDHTNMKPNTPCQFNDTSDAVKDLQSFLASQGKLQPYLVTGFYGPLTAKAVLWWQLENWNKFFGGVPKLLDLGGKYWGEQSISAMLP